ncbi:MAG: biotin/lipoyl-binding protein [Nitrospiraceae bacterium]
MDEIAVDDLATSTKLNRGGGQLQIPERLRFSSRLAIKLVALLHPDRRLRPLDPNHYRHRTASPYTPFERPQDIEAQITGRIRKWHIFEGVRVKQGDIILELDDYDPTTWPPTS